MTESTHPTLSQHNDLCDALDRVRLVMAELPKSKLLLLNLDPLAAAAKVRGALPNLMAIRPLLANPIPSFDIANLDWLETYALALIQAEAVHRTVTSRHEQLPLLLAEAFELRERLVAEANILVRRGLLAASRLSRLSVPNGYRNIGADLLTLVTALRDGWSKVAGFTAIQPSELDYAAKLGDALICGIALRKRATAEAAAARDNRQRAYTLLVRAYDEVRWTVLYLRRHDGDGDRIAPSLYGRRPSRPRKSRSANAPEAPSSNPEPVQGPSKLLQIIPKDSTDSSVRNIIDDPFMH